MRTIFQNCTLLDGTEQMTPRPGTDVAIEDDRIAQIGKITPNKGDRVVDLTGKYLMPGLINLHVHLPAGGKPRNKPMNTNRLTKIALSSGLSRALVLRMCHAYAMQGLLSGVTTVRAVGGLDNLDTRLRDRIHAGKLDGPRILAANYAIGVPHGHMVGSVTHPAETVEDAVRMVDQLHGQNVDLIKLMITGGAGGRRAGRYGHRYRLSVHHPLQYVAGAALFPKGSGCYTGVCALYRHIKQRSYSGAWGCDRQRRGGQMRRLAHRKQRPAGRLSCPGAAIYGSGSRQGLRPSANQKIPCLRCGTG